METSDVIHFSKGLPPGDALCPRIFTLFINPINGKITHFLYIDDTKIYAASESKLDRVLKTTKAAMADIGLEFNEKKCAVAHVKKGVLDSCSNTTHVGEPQIIQRKERTTNS